MTSRNPFLCIRSGILLEHLQDPPQRAEVLPPRSTNLVPQPHSLQNDVLHLGEDVLATEIDLVELGGGQRQEEVRVRELEGDVLNKGVQDCSRQTPDVAVFNEL